MKQWPLSRGSRDGVGRDAALGAAPSAWIAFLHHITEWLEVEGTLEIISFQPRDSLTGALLLAVGSKLPAVPPSSGFFNPVTLGSSW